MDEALELNISNAKSNLAGQDPGNIDGEKATERYRPKIALREGHCVTLVRSVGPMHFELVKWHRDRIAA